MLCGIGSAYADVKLPALIGDSGRMADLSFQRYTVLASKFRRMTNSAPLQREKIHEEYADRADGAAARADLRFGPDRGRCRGRKGILGAGGAASDGLQGLPRSY